MRSSTSGRGAIGQCSSGWFSATSVNWLSIRLSPQAQLFRALGPPPIRCAASLLETELLTFPQGKTDDIVDSISQALSFDPLSFDSTFSWV
jgi:hypothetical protein